jgi:phosphoribosylformimino-5-aminoimidazole carboxamide ribotide isomerase
LLVLPAIDLLDGKAVRLRQGRYDQVTVYSDDPVAVARGLRGKVPRLHVVDLAGAKAGRAVQRDVVRSIVEAFGPGVQVGGGVRSRDTLLEYVALGADRVVLGTAAIRDLALVRALAREHPGRLVVALDAHGGRVATDGWTRVSERTVFEVARELGGEPLAALLYTDVARDGTREGPNLETTARLAREAHVGVIASGGVGTQEDLRALARCPGVEAAIVGRALYDGSLSLEDAIAAAR